MSTLLPIAQLKGLPETDIRPFESVLLLQKVQEKTARNGNPFLLVELSDVTGSLSTTCFGDSPLFDFFKHTPVGSVLHIEGTTDRYQGKLSPRLIAASLIPADRVAAERWLDQLIPSSFENPESLAEACLSFVQKISHPQLRTTVQNVFDEIGPAFYVCPGAISMHHAYRHGLLEHTVRMARAAEKLLPLYPEVDADLALAGILLHDAGKTLEYTCGSPTTKKTRLGLLQGHVVLGYRMVRKGGLMAKLDPLRLERLEHIILSHQGELEWGAAAMAATPEAVFVSMIDNLDAKMGMVQQALRQANEQAEFSDYLPGLKASLYTQALIPTETNLNLNAQDSEVVEL